MATSALAFGARNESAYPDGPPPGFTGGFGEESCAGCHFGGAANDTAGSFRLSGVPVQYEPGKSYAILVSLSRPGMKIGGFQLSARLQEDGSQAGTLLPDSTDAARLERVTDRGIDYIHQRYPTMDGGSPDSLLWKLTWIAPDGSRAVIFHSSANAADGDGSVSGDHVYTTSVMSVSP